MSYKSYKNLKIYQLAHQYQGSRIKDGVSILLVLLIVSALLVAGIAVTDLIIRHTRVTKGVEFSEQAYFAAESAIEKVLYKVFKEHCTIGTNCGVSGDLGISGLSYEITNANVIADTSLSPWSQEVGSGKSLVFDLDLNGVTYPGTITIGSASMFSSDLIILEREKTGSTWSTNASKTEADFPHTLNVASDKYYKIRINNRHTAAQTYAFTFSGNLPIGLKINESIGRYRSYTRKIQTTVPKWQLTSGGT